MTVSPIITETGFSEWRLFHADFVHCVPISDLRPHLVSDFDVCWCGALADEYGCIVHHAMDQRERSEQRGRLDS